MFCERTAMNIRHVACRWRGTAISRTPPPPTRAVACVRVHCRWRVTRRFSFCPWSLEHTQFCVAGTGTTFSLARPENESTASIRYHLERPSTVLSRPCCICTKWPARQQKSLCTWPEPLPTLCIFVRMWISYVLFESACVLFVVFVGCMFRIL